MNPKDRLRKAVHRLAGAAEKLEEIVCPVEYDLSGQRADVEPNVYIPGDSLPNVIREGLKEVRQQADEIERIIR